MNVVNWFTGVVEDISDPLEMGRVRVRCFNFHNPDTSEIPTEDLPWATCVMPVTSASTSGIGSSATGLLPGSWVVGIFRDGLESQDPVILGSVPTSSSGIADVGGFNDPYGTFPNSAGNDIPGVSMNYGYGTGPSFQSQRSAYDNFNGSAVGFGNSTETLTGPNRVIEISGDGNKILSAARSQLSVRETSKNQGSGISKYWSATNYKGGYAAREPWCAAFVCWCIQQAGIFSESDRPKTASAFGFEGWARSLNSPKVKLFVRPSAVQQGDLVIFSWSHIGIASVNSDVNRQFKSVDGNSVLNGQQGVVEKNRNLSGVRSCIRITP